MDVVHAYAALKNVCETLENTGDYAVAAYVGHGMALLEEKYGMACEAVASDPVARSESIAHF